MASFGTGALQTPKIIVCSQCNKIMVSTYVVDGKCPACSASLFPQDEIYMPNLEDAYRLAEIRVMKKLAKENGFDDDDDDS